ncbi:hypothetical protein GIB67_001820 [Kingdonia uniflora]|uniref:FYR C-terminal domain-containing protein n=1 Tax=Kingdonia uniflora TaxID=39325 RepID=A0A7J7LC14_9MAGN|nr:hypothetical protein GIB67_001820 [Kingdonia uniflora]
MSNPNHGGKPDGLEIISIGALFEGSNDKKYWSSSRGKDRYPYPIGYHAIRTHIGFSYKMEIHEGLNGPLFVVTGADGESTRGQTPEIACEGIQKKGGIHAKLGHGKRFSCKIDGAELFGFRNPLVHRLLRELVSNVTGTAEQIPLSPSLSNREAIQDPEPQPYLLRAKARKKRNRKENWVHLNDDNYYTSSTSDEDERVHKYFGASLEHVGATSYVDRGNNAIIAEESSPLEAPKFTKGPKNSDLLQEHKSAGDEDSRMYFVAINLSNQEKQLDRSLGGDSQDCASIILKKDIDGETSTSSEPRTVKDCSICVPDTFDLLQVKIKRITYAVNFAHSAPESYKGSPCHIKDELAAPVAVVSGEMGMDSHPEEESITSSPNASSEKSDFDSVGRELAKSMMNFLLPQAVPLLKKKTSSKKRTTTRKTDISITDGDNFVAFAILKAPEKIYGPYNALEVNYPGKSEVLMPLEFSTKKGGNMLVDTFSGSDVHSSEDLKSIIPDSFEDERLENHLSHQKSSQSDIIEADQAPPDKRECNSDTSGLLGCVGDIGINENNGVLASDSHLGCISRNKRVFTETTCKDACIKFRENSLKRDSDLRVDDSVDKELEIVPDSTKDILGIEPSMLMPTQPPYFRGENKSESRIPNLVPANEKSSGLTSVSNSTKNLETTNSEVCKTQFGQYYYRRRRYKTTAPQSSNGCRDQVNSNTCGSQENVSTIGLSATRDKNPPCMVTSDISQKEVNVKITTINTSNASSKVHISGATSLTRKYNGPLSESIIFRNAIEGCVPEILSTPESLFTTEIVEAGPSNHTLSREVSFANKVKHGRPNTENGVLMPKELISDAVKDNNISSFVGPSISEVQQHEAKPKMVRESFVELVGCYVHPAPILSVQLSTQEANIHISVLCGLLADRAKSIFIYKVPIKQPRGVCPSFLGHSLIMLPTSKGTFCTEIALERLGLQFTPDGQYLVVPNSIKVPLCSELVEEFGLPSLDYTSPRIEELKKISNCATLVIGHNGFGEFVLWDISRRVILSRFSSPRTFVFQVLPVGLFGWESKKIAPSSLDVEDHIKEIMAASQIYFSKSSRNLPYLPNGEDIGIWLLVFASCDSESQNDYQTNGINASSNGCWRLALLVKDTVIFGRALDPRASTVNTIEGCGIIGTSDGLVYIWELSTGINLGNLLHFKGGNVSCITADQKSGLLAVAGEEGKLVVYAINSQGIQETLM